MDVGFVVGVFDGFEDGGSVTAVGVSLGVFDGVDVGVIVIVVGAFVVGAFDGDKDGSSVVEVESTVTADVVDVTDGGAVGTEDGANVEGEDEGSFDGCSVGCLVGLSVGCGVGSGETAVGEAVASDGGCVRPVGAGEGSLVVEPDNVGVAVVHWLVSVENPLIVSGDPDMYKALATVVVDPVAYNETYPE